jgi:hypothetical protein
VALFALSALWIGSTSIGLHAAASLGSPEITGSLTPPEAPYELRSYIVAPGEESFELAARLREYGGIITRPVSWRILRVRAAEAGGSEEVYRGEAPIADFDAVPGEYRVDITYGFAVYSRTITLEAERHISAVFNLNVGGLRVLSRLSVPASGISFRTSHRIYALSGESRGRLLAENAIPGDVLRLPAGRYRIESELRPGNAVAGTNIEIKPGLMSAVEIDHVAGVVHLAAKTAATQQVAWEITDANGNVAADAKGKSVDMILKPGRYEAKALVGANTKGAAFTVRAGETIEVSVEP